MILDPSQVAVIVASGAVTLVTSVIGLQLRKHTLRQEKSARRREARQEMHYRKLDAVIFALASASENISGPTFKRTYDEKMKEFMAESEMMGSFE